MRCLPNAQRQILGLACLHQILGLDIAFPMLAIGTGKCTARIGVRAKAIALLMGRLRVGSLLSMLVTGGFLFAYCARHLYGGSMVLSDGSEKLVQGINLGLFAFGMVFVLLAVVFIRAKTAANH